MSFLVILVIQYDVTTFHVVSCHVLFCQVRSVEDMHCRDVPCRARVLSGFVLSRLHVVESHAVTNRHHHHRHHHALSNPFRTNADRSGAIAVTRRGKFSVQLCATRDWCEHQRAWCLARSCTVPSPWFVRRSPCAQTVGGGNSVWTCFPFHSLSKSRTWYSYSSLRL